jgi:lipopolysaccharide export system protein LptA
MMRMIRPFFLAAALGAASFAAFAQSGPVSALKGHNSNAPVDVAADRIEVQDRSDRAIFAGNVKVRQEQLTLDTQRLTVAYSSAGGIQIRRLDASGG